MTDESAFIQAILADPDDDSPRLIYSDWLDEQGQCDQAEFIRVQCAKASLETRAGPSFWTAMCKRPESGCQCDWHVLRRREQELLDASSGVRAEGRNAEWTNRVAWFEPWRRYCQSLQSTIGWTFHRGFVCAITIEAANWLRHAGNCYPREGTDDPPLIPGTILASQPVEEVTLTTMPDHLHWLVNLRLEGYSYQIPSRETKWIADTFRADDPLPMLRNEWPRIKKWTLPAIDAHWNTQPGDIAENIRAVGDRFRLGLSPLSVTPDEPID